MQLPVPSKRPEFTLDECLRLTTETQAQILEHLAEVAIRQKAEARRTKRRFQRGWTYLRTSQHVKLASIQALIRHGLVEACCEGHDGTDLVRISRKGIELLESIRGEVIYA